MFEVGWSEILVIVIVLIVVVGPKDLPKMLRAFGKATAKFRATAGEFRRQFDEALKEAELDDVRDIINDAKSLDPRNDIRKVFDPVRTIGEDLRSTLKDAGTAAKDNLAIPDPSAPGATQVQPQVMEPVAPLMTATTPKKPGRTAKPKAAAEKAPAAATAATKAAPAKAAPAKVATKATPAKTVVKATPAAKTEAEAPVKAAPAKRTTKPRATGKAGDTGTKS
ncbi:Sec-independent protein translocase protein TatB [Phyllobacterium sp. P30BS-XVII]|uniref:Sec-independent protein translocase protein TatB n=1 Tax=Phyllobacterium sp. P30BS-XVII TaxID=2587046 RepID=UPI0015F90E7E|nr:Sec-independent protein translocase protein TatB [Phyllobacterium sp. P30BS-XVII]MBA8902399.1 sec-independent protein translocase protein TatB [Phyllobacterium sp. P30BS-XVII]